jgi:DNA-directed RNA polymerase subunit omega
MARVTVEDSLKAIGTGGMFYMIRLAAFRAHQLQHGATPLVPLNGDKPTVVALREIAAGHTEFDDVKVPEKDVFGRSAKMQGPEVNKPRHWGTGSTAYIADETDAHYMVRNKTTGTIIGENLTLAEAEACKGRVEELIIELRKAK